MKIVKENKVQEAVKPVDFSVTFDTTFKRGDSQSREVYTVKVDGHKIGVLDQDDIEKFIKLKLDFMKKFEALLK